MREGIRNVKNHIRQKKSKFKNERENVEQVKE